MRRVGGWNLTMGGGGTEGWGRGGCKALLRSPPRKGKLSWEATGSERAGQPEGRAEKHGDVSPAFAPRWPQRRPPSQAAEKERLLFREELHPEHPIPSPTGTAGAQLAERGHPSPSCLIMHHAGGLHGSLAFLEGSLKEALPAPMLSGKDRKEAQRAST